MSDNFTATDIRDAAVLIAKAVHTARTDPWEIPEEFRDVLVDAATTADECITVGDYDGFKLAIALVTATPLGGEGRRKWQINNIAGEVIWRVNRDKIKADMARGVDEFLGELFPDE